MMESELAEHLAPQMAVSMGYWTVGRSVSLWPDLRAKLLAALSENWKVGVLVAKWGNQEAARWAYRWALNSDERRALRWAGRLVQLMAARWVVLKAGLKAQR